MIIGLVAMPVEIIKAIVYYSKAKKLDNDIRKKKIFKQQSISVKLTIF